jgi:hypothetical protein
MSRTHPCAARSRKAARWRRGRRAPRSGRTSAGSGCSVEAAATSRCCSRCGYAASRCRGASRRAAKAVPLPVSGGRPAKVDVRRWRCSRPTTEAAGARSVVARTAIRTAESGSRIGASGWTSRRAATVTASAGPRCCGWRMTAAEPTSAHVAATTASVEAAATTTVTSAPTLCKRRSRSARERSYSKD